jgi:GAF domain-containing protein
MEPDHLMERVQRSVDELRAEAAYTRQIAEVSRRWLAGYRKRLAFMNPAAILDAAIRATGADFGNIQMLRQDGKSLEIVAQRGFAGEFLEYFSRVHGNQAACGTAMASGGRVVIEDVLLDPIFLDPDLQRIMTRANVRAVQSTPVVARSGGVLGIVSTHFRAPHHLETYQLHIVELLGRQVADLIECDGLAR